MSAFELLGKLGVTFGKDQFVSHLQPTFINYLSDLKTSLKGNSYSFSNIKEYYENIVYVSDNDLDVLGDYFDFYSNLKLSEQDI